MTQAETDKLAKHEHDSEVVSPRAIYSEAPQDPALPGLQSVLSTEHMTAHLAGRLGRPETSIIGCEIKYVRYKPGTNCLVAYGITTVDQETEMLAYGKVYTKEDYERARLKIKSHRWVQNDELPAPIELNKERAILYFFPDDCLLEGLRILSDNKKIQRLLYDWYDTYPESVWRISDRRLNISPVRYKPERRAVLRCDTRATHRTNGSKSPLTVYVRIYSDGRGGNNFRLMESLYRQTVASDKLRIPRPLGYLASRNLLMMEGLAGSQFKEAQAAAEDNELYTRLGSALAIFHTLTANVLERRSVNEVATESFSGAESLAKLIPEIATTVTKVKALLKELTPNDSGDMLGLVHGDFHQGQTLIADDSVGIIDFDRAHLGDQCADLGELCAHLRLSDLRGEIPSYQDVEAAFLAGYEKASGITLKRQRLTYWTALRLLSLAVSPFRRLEQHWRAKVREITIECEKLLRE